jgi:hypothetical protein
MIVRMLKSDWKQTLIVTEARRDGFEVVHIGRQTLLRRHSSERC